MLIRTNPTPKADDGGLQTAWVMNADGSKPRKLDEKEFATHTARWSPDGKWIAFLSRAGDDIYQQNLFVTGAEGGEARKLTNGFELDAEEPHWAPDGKTIYFSAIDRETVEVFAADVAGAKVKKVTEKQGVVQLAQIGANGTAVGTTADPKHLDELFKTDLKFGAIEPLTNHNAWLAE